jgi:hypothetical protein
MHVNIGSDEPRLQAATQNTTNLTDTKLQQAHLSSRKPPRPWDKDSLYVLVSQALVAGRGLNVTKKLRFVLRKRVAEKPTSPSHRLFCET